MNRIRKTKHVVLAFLVIAVLGTVSCVPQVTTPVAEEEGVEEEVVEEEEPPTETPTATTPPTSTPTDTLTVTLTATSTATATAIMTETPTATLTATPLPTATPQPTATPSSPPPQPTATPSSPPPPTATSSSLPESTAETMPPLALSSPLDFLQLVEDTKWSLPHQVQTQGTMWTGVSISQTVHFDGTNLYQNFGNGQEAWILPGQRLVLRQNGQIQQAGADIAAQAMDRTRNGWRDGITEGSIVCEIGEWANQTVIACRYTRTGTFAGEETFNRLVVYVDPVGNRPLAVTNTFNPTANPNTTGSGTTSYTYVPPPPIVPPQ